MDDALGNGRSMGPAEGKGEQSVGMAGCANTDTAHSRGRKANAPEAVGKVNGGNAGRWGEVFVSVEKGTDLKKGGEAELGRGERAVGIEGPHVDNEGGLVLRFPPDKGFSIREAGVEGNQASNKEGI
jgi:hypothetical protein